MAQTIPPQKVSKRSVGGIITTKYSIDKERNKELVRYWSEYYGNDINLAFCLVNLESGFDHLAKNPNSTAAGIWQFLETTFNSTVIRMGHPEWNYNEHVYNAEINAQMGSWLLHEDGYTHWIVWKSCINQ